MTEPLPTALEALHTSLLNGKLPRNLHWTQVIDLIRHIGTVEDHGNNEFVFSVGTQRSTFSRPHGSELEVEETARLRKFLRDAGAAPDLSSLPKPLRMIVVIDHHDAHVYQDVDASRPADEKTIRPYDPHGFQHHLVHKKEADYRGERVPEENSFYEEVAKAIRPAAEIVIIGDGTGTSSAAVYLNEFLKTHHWDIFQKVIATADADLSAVTEPEIEAIARRHLVDAVVNDGQTNR